ncbi:MAG: hypothetical protein V4591_04485 [Bdellovibrionota bacterium]
MPLLRALTTNTAKIPPSHPQTSNTRSSKKPSQTLTTPYSSLFMQSAFPHDDTQGASEAASPEQKKPRDHIKHFTYPSMMSLIPKGEAQQFEHINIRLRLMEEEKLSLRAVHKLGRSIQKLYAAKEPINQLRAHMFSVLFLCYRSLHYGLSSNFAAAQKNAHDFLLSNETKFKQCYSDEINWYRVLLWKSQPDKNEFLEILEDVIPRIKSKKHKEALFYGNYMTTLQETMGYPTPEKFEKLEKNFEDLNFEHLPLDGKLAQWRHDYVSKLFEHPLLKTDSSLSHSKQPFSGYHFHDVKDFTPCSKEIRTDVGIQISNNFGIELLLKYFWHLCPNRYEAPQILFSVDGTNKILNEKFNALVHAELKKLGIVPSKGSLPGTKRVLLDVAHRLNLSIHHDRLELYLKWINAQYQELKKYFETLDGFNDEASIQLFFECVSLQQQYGMTEELRQKIASVVKICLKILHNMNQINNNSANTESQKKEKFYSLSKNITKEFFEKKQSFILKVGTPIPPEEKGQPKKRYSKHAFYVVFKVEEDRFQIILVNGGQGVTPHHLPSSPDGVPQDLSYYRYAAFENLNFDKSTREKIEHYIYRLLILGYTESEGKEGDQTDENGKFLGVSPINFDYLLKNIYMHTQNPLGQSSHKNPVFFYGYKDVEVAGFEKSNLKEDYLGQIVGNCTVHNLKKALAILYNFNEVDVGLLDDHMLLAFDQFLKTNFSEIKLSSSALQREALSITTS